MEFSLQMVKYLPLTISGWHALTCIITYIIAVRESHVYYMFPYISDTGSMSPESNVFGQCFNIGAALMVIAVYIRYKQVQYDIRTKNIVLKPILNKVGLTLGIIASFGGSIVGNFSQLSILSIHVIGALLAMGIGTFYIYVQTWISTYYLKARYRKISDRVFFIRCCLTSVLGPLFFSVFGFAFLSAQDFPGGEEFFAQFDEDFVGVRKLIWWTEEFGGYGYHLISVFSEWFLFIAFFVYITTFTVEFQHIELIAVNFKFKQ